MYQTVNSTAALWRAYALFYSVCSFGDTQRGCWDTVNDVNIVCLQRTVDFRDTVLNTYVDTKVQSYGESIWRQRWWKSFSIANVAVMSEYSGNASVYWWWAPQLGWFTRASIAGWSRLRLNGGSELNWRRKQPQRLIKFISLLVPNETSVLRIWACARKRHVFGVKMVVFFFFFLLFQSELQSFQSVPIVCSSTVFMSINAAQSWKRHTRSVTTTSTSARQRRDVYTVRPLRPSSLWSRFGGEQKFSKKLLFLLYFFFLNQLLL